MSSDFSGKNSSIKSDDLFMMMSDTLASRLRTTRELLIRFYQDNGVCGNEDSLEIFDRYNTDPFDSNAYSDNEFDDISILDQAIGKEELLDKELSSAPQRKEIIENACSSLQQNGLCNDFTLSSFFPHLDCAKEIIALGNDRSIECADLQNYSIIYGQITYCASCDESFQEPSPYYPADFIDGRDGRSILIRDTRDDAKYQICNSKYRWEIVENESNVVIYESTASMDKNVLSVATSPAAITQSIKVALEFSET